MGSVAKAGTIVSKGYPYSSIWLLNMTFQKRKKSEHLLSMNWVYAKGKQVGGSESSGLTNTSRIVVFSSCSENYINTTSTQKSVRIFCIWA